MSSDFLQLNVAKNVEKEKITRLFKTMCRCCCAQQNDLTSIFDSETPADELIFTFTSIKFSKDDSYPQNICADCFAMLNNCNTFRQQVQAADKFLREFKSAREEIQEIDEKDLHFDIPENSMCDQDICMDFGLISDSDNEQNIFQEVIDIESDGDGSTSGEVDDMNDVDYVDEAGEDRDLEPEKKSTNSKPKSILKCETCKRIFANNEFYRKHMKEHSTSKFYSCGICYHRFSEQEDLENHMKRHGKKDSNEESSNTSSISKTKCPKCDQEFSVLKDQDIHMSVHSPPRNSKYTCKGCSKLFDSLVQLKRHIFTHFVEKPFKCDTCGKGFPEMGSLTRHIKIHSETKRTRNFECSVCNKKYFESHALKIHQRTHTGEKPYPCQLCEKSFSDVRLLNSHKKTHSQKKNFVCDECGQRFNHHSTLISHKRVHTGEKPFSCVVCSKAFTQASNLQVHMRTHSGERPYSCELCGDSFTNSSTLKVHSKIHYNEKKPGRASVKSKYKYTCNYCDTNFTNARKLNLHKASHTVGKENRCRDCNKSWSLRSYYIQHMKTVHKIDIPEAEKQLPSLEVVEGYNDDSEMVNNEALVDALINAVQQQNHENQQQECEVT